MEIRQHIQAGCSFGPDDLAHAEWRSLALLEIVVADVLEERMKR